mgnify:CR=1 FL=1
MKKKDVLDYCNVSSLKEIDDEKLLTLAEDGLLGRETKWAALRVWAFESKRDCAEHIRKALDLGKELRVSISEGEYMSKDQITIEYV